MADPYARSSKPVQEGPTPKQRAADLDVAIKTADARVAEAQRTAETVKKQTDARIAEATSADQIIKARADAQKAEADLEKALLELERLKNAPPPLTEGQGKASNFYRRTLSSNIALDRLNLDPDSLIGATGYQYAPSLTALASSDERNAYRAAVENFIAATLRLESGAAIAPSEFERQYRIYFPQPGAGPKEIEQKRQMRELAISGLKAEAGPGAQQAEQDLVAQGFLDADEVSPTAEGEAGAKGRMAEEGAETALLAVPEELQSAVRAYVDAKGKDIDAQEFKEFFNKNAEQIGYIGRVTDEEAKRNADAIRAGGRYGGVEPAERPLSAVERGVNEFLLSNTGAAATGAFNAVSMGVPAMLSENIGRSTEGVRDENGLAFGIGELVGNLAMTGAGGFGLMKAGLSAPRAELLSDLIYSGVTGATGAPEGERLAGAATNMLLSGVGAAAPTVVQRTLKTNPDEDIKILREAGVRLTPAQTAGGRIDRTEEAAARLLFGGGDMALSSRRRAFNDFNTAFLNSAGKYIGFQLPNDLKAHERMKAIGKAFDDQYDVVRAQMSVAPDQQFLDDINDLRAVINDGSTFSSENAARLSKLLEDQLVRRTTTQIGGDEYKSLQSLLKKRRDAYARSENTELADGVASLETILDNAARRHSPPEAVQMLDETDRGFALLAQAQEAARMAGNRPGEFSPAQILSRQRAADPRNRSRSFVEGDMEGQRLAEAGQNVLGNVLPTSGTTERLAAASAAGAVGTLVSPYALVPNALIGAVNAPGVRDVLPAVFAGRRPAGVEMVGELMDKYKVPLRYLGAQSGRMFNPYEQTPEDYTVTDVEALEVTPEAMRIAAEQPALGDLTSKYAGDMVDAAGNEVAPAEAPGPKAGDTIVVENRDAVYDPTAEAYIFVDTGEIARKAMQRGGMVKGYKGGGLLKYLPDAEDVKGFGRSVAEGAMLGYNDNTEAYLRTLFDKDPEAYKRELARIRRDQIKYKQDHPVFAGIGEGAGMVGTAFVPGMQGLSAARAAQMGPKARAAYELALGTAQGTAYGSGKMYDDPDSKRDPLAVLASETAAGTLGYPASRAAVAGGRALGRRVPQGAKDFVARKGRELAGSLSVRRPVRK